MCVHMYMYVCVYMYWNLRSNSWASCYPCDHSTGFIKGTNYDFEAILKTDLSKDY